jgi:hypothetical protein
MRIHGPRLDTFGAGSFNISVAFCGVLRDSAAYCWLNRQSLMLPSSLPEASQWLRESKATV